VQAGHRGGCPGLVEEDEPLGIEIELALEPGEPLREDVGAILLGRMRGLFFSVIRWRWKNRQIVPMPNPAPSAASAAWTSASVMSGVASISLRIIGAQASIRADRRSPPCCRGRASPCRRRRAFQRIALDTLTPKRAAAARHDIPPSTAANTRVLRSIDSAFAMPAGLHSGRQFESDHRRVGESSANLSARKPL
jgi:hypothetical protein